MKYNPGDLVINFDSRTLFVWSKQDERRKYIHRLRLATPGEKKLFDKKFLKKNEISFEEFKKIMPVFDGRKLKGIIYDHITLDESLFLFFREFKTNLHNATLEEKLDFLIMKYLQAIEHNISTGGQDKQRLEKMGSLLSELLILAKDG